MTLRCPHCSSKRIARSQTTTAVVTSLGALSGIASAVLTAARHANKPTSITFTPITIANFIVRGLIGGISGSQIGAQLGSQLDQSYQCNSCKRKFSPAIALN